MTSTPIVKATALARVKNIKKMQKEVQLSVDPITPASAKKPRMEKVRSNDLELGLAMSISHEVSQDCPPIILSVVYLLPAFIYMCPLPQVERRNRSGFISTQEYQEDERRRSSLQLDSEDEPEVENVEPEVEPLKKHMEPYFKYVPSPDMFEETLSDYVENSLEEGEIPATEKTKETSKEESDEEDCMRPSQYVPFGLQQELNAPSSPMVDTEGLTDESDEDEPAETVNHIQENSMTSDNSADETLR